ncbi:MAG TPA: class A beta-lactamase [Pyrinomonadaceae bacterium]|jgi:beta-lactamase class A|nr:class A beta-lactamase [Pyrinomonadaceae bacterium]
MRLNSLPILLLFSTLGLTCTRSSTTAETKKGNASPSPVATGAQNQPGNVEQELEKRLKTICDRAQGTVGLSVVHIESGKTISINSQTQLPLYSVFKLPLAIVVLKDVEESRLQLDQKIHGTPADIVPGTPGNEALWQKPVDYTIAELLGFSISRSDNTSSDKLLQLVGGPQKVTERMRLLGFQNLDIHSTGAEYVKSRQNPNIGSAEDLANLLAQLHQEKILQSSQQSLLIGFMQRATTGMRRLRGNLPTGTLVADKTGAGEKDAVTRVAKATNDVGIITLPSGRGHLAIAVLVSESKLPDAAQEKLIAELARAAYDAYSTDAAKGSTQQ